LTSEESEDKSTNLEVHIEPYQGDVAEVWKVSEELLSIEENVFLACVHGSLGTYDNISYSDFDALVILRDSAFENVSTLIEVAEVLTKCQKHMRHFDPLQHHGWFVLTEYDLINYCEAYFPIALFNYAKSISSRKRIKLALKTRNSTFELEQAFFGA